MPPLDTNMIGQLNETINCDITKNEILKCIRKLKNNKACSDDLIINEYIKSTCDKFISIYEKLFNLIFKTGIVPKSWIMGIIKHFLPK